MEVVEEYKSGVPPWGGRGFMTATGTYGMRNELTTNSISIKSALGYEDFQRK